VQESLLIEEEIAGEHAWRKSSLEEITRRELLYFAERLLRMLRFPIVEFSRALEKS